MGTKNHVRTVAVDPAKMAGIGRQAHIGAHTEESSRVRETPPIIKDLGHPEEAYR